MGSGSFLVGALRYLTDALVESLFHHDYVKPAGEDEEARLVEERISALLSDELLKLKPGHEGFEETLRAQLKRHVVERCLYGVDIDPLAVELGRMALWVETMDRDLPFGFLDHKLKAGNALVGAWFDTYREYPAMAWQREGGDKDYQKGKPDNLINHYYVKTHTSGKKKGQQETKGDVFTDAIKRRGKAVPEQLIAIITGQVDMDERLPAADVHDELLKVFRKLHRLPVHESDKRAELYREQILKNPHYHDLKARMDLWCALWFWPGESIDSAPLPQDFLAPSAEALSIAQQVAQTNRFFHWELEYPDVFKTKKSGFDAVLGNPPWEIHKPNSKEFFSNYDPLYRAYGKQEALGKQLEYFGSNPELEHSWIQYNAGFKAMSNWAKYVGVPFGDRVTEDNKGKKKHDLSLGGGGKNTFEKSEQLHKLWRKRRKAHKGFADSAHPFLHQGSADLNTYKMFLEQSHAIMGQAGRLGMIVPSGLYTDKGTTDLRTLFLEHCDWQWLFGFENREGIFDIHRSFKFCPLVIQKGMETKAIRAAFMHRNVDDWEQAESYVLAYPGDRVLELSPYSKSILEIRSDKDLEVLKKIYANGVLLGDQSGNGWGVQYAREFDMTNDSKLFPERPKWEAKEYQPDEYGHWVKGAWSKYDGPTEIAERESGLVLSRDGTEAVSVKAISGVALPVYNAKNFDLWDYCSAGWISGKGRGAKWEDIAFPKAIKPEYLMDFSVYEDQSKIRSLPKLLFKDISTAIHKRTMMSALVPDFPAVNASPVLATTRQSSDNILLQTMLGSFVFDYVAKFKIGYLHLNYFIISECPIIQPQVISPVSKFLTDAAIRLSGVSECFAKMWLSYYSNRERGWRASWAITNHERLRLRVVIDAIIAYLVELNGQDISWLLESCDHPKDRLRQKAFTNQLDQKRFWRVDRQHDPELRHTVLMQVAFEDLKKNGLSAFIDQNNGEGWLIPETLRLADYGLGHDDRAQEHQPVASRLGPRFYDWQLNEDVERSWEECAAHAELIRQIVPEPESVDEVAEESADYKVESTQGALF
ncbi:MAG: hypothetical protein CMN16_07535 [Roseovarius sp.]|nr:hypothetical protein [Roseovarius sp.]